MEFSTRAIHAGQELDESTGAAVPPIQMSTIYAYEAPGVTRAGFEYIRYGNPTRAALETCLGSLENAPADCPALCFASGMAATDAAMRLLKPGDRLLLANETYGGTFRLAEEFLRPSGIIPSYFDATDPGAFDQAFTPGIKMVWLETPSNPLLTITDLTAVSARAHEVGALVAVDSTFGTPYLQNPLDLGVDIVMHSTTKYLGGHSDVLGGVLVTNKPDIRKSLFSIQWSLGAVSAPFDCWLTLRGVRSLAARMRVHEANARAVAQFLSNHPGVEKVHYPGLPDHPQHELAKRQMRGFGGMVSFEVKGGEGAARALLARTNVFTLAASLGGVESIISYPRMMSHAVMPAEERQRRGITDGLIRLSIGLEDEKDLVEDLARALEGARGQAAVDPS